MEDARSTPLARYTALNAALPGAGGGNTRAWKLWEFCVRARLRLHVCNRPASSRILTTATRDRPRLSARRRAIRTVVPHRTGTVWAQARGRRRYGANRLRMAGRTVQGGTPTGCLLEDHVRRRQVANFGQQEAVALLPWWVLAPRGLEPAPFEGHLRGGNDASMQIRFLLGHALVHTTEGCLGGSRSSR